MYAQIMAKLLKTKRIRFSEDDEKLMLRLKELKVKPMTFIRIAFREKVERDLNELIKEEQRLKSKEYCPF